MSQRCSLVRRGASFLNRHLWRSGRDGRIKPPFVSLCPGLQVSPSDGEGPGKHLYLKSTLSTAPLSEWSKWLLAHTLTSGKPRALPVLAVSLEPLYGDCFISVPVRPRGGRGPEEDDPHFLKAKCSVLISRNEQPVTWVNLLELERFIVSCHS